MCRESEIYKPNVGDLLVKLCIDTKYQMILSVAVFFFLVADVIRERFTLRRSVKGEK